ncbi:MAG: FAD-dependent oxidoreductase [Alphaproteobacteria bacterium]|nr:FAD-dependent oxidoreductase [Alphaproteobacteria bacterium]
MASRADVIVLGGGPAGMCAASAAARAGSDSLLIDENSQGGGQVYRAPPAAFAETSPGAFGPDHAIGASLRLALADSGARTAFGCRAWSVSRDVGGAGFRVDVCDDNGLKAWRAPALVVATGATERVLPFPGWTLPGVHGLAAATVMLKAQKLLPGERVAVAGCGPLLLAVAAGIAKAGGKVAGVIDLASVSDWLRVLPGALSRPDLLARGAAWVAGIAAAGTPYLRRHAVTAALGDDRVSAIALSPVAADGTVDRASQPLRIDCDALVIGHGLVPNCDVTRILGATHRYAPADGGWIAVRDGDMRTSIPGLYMAGDGGGISGAAAAALQGELAGLAAARDLGALAAQRHLDLAAPLRRRLGRAMRFGRAMAGLMVERPGLVASIPAETPVCRCEDVTRAEIDQAVAEGAREVNQVKAWTRCGMGPCQGRMCGDTVAAVVARLVGGRSAAGAFTARVPLRPVPTAQLIGSFDYADIPIPRPAPL